MIKMLSAEGLQTVLNAFLGEITAIKNAAQCIAIDTHKILKIEELILEEIAKNDNRK